MHKKSMKLPKGSSKAANRRTTDNTMTKTKRTNHDLHNITHTTKIRVTRTPLKTGGELRCSVPYINVYFFPYFTTD